LETLMLGEFGGKWLDRYHQQLAKELRSQGWSQMEIASITGTTQSTVSRMLSKPVFTIGSSSDDVIVDAWAQESAQTLTQIGPNAEVIRQRLILEIQFNNGHTYRSDKTLTGIDLDSNQEREALLQRLDWSVGRLDANRLTNYIPAVGMNIATCVERATKPEDIAAYPGRLTIVGGELRNHEDPEFGASQHLAKLLLDAKIVDRAKMAIMNIKPPMLNGLVDRGDIDYLSDELEFKLAISKKGVLQKHIGRIDIILDEGDFGWEPALYILAHNTMELIERCHEIIDGMNTA